MKAHPFSGLVYEQKILGVSKNVSDENSDAEAKDEMPAKWCDTC